MLAIDHIAIASKDPEQEAKDFGEKHGMTTIPGGKHTNWGTYNYLSYLNNNSYIEWIGVFDETLARKSDNPLITELMQFFDNGESGPMTFALRTKDMNSNLAYFENKAIPFIGPFPGARKRPNGYTLSWRMLFMEQAGLPFLIEWAGGINLPDDKTQINKNKPITLTIPGIPDAYQDVFQLPENDNIIQLENGKLHFIADAQFDFDISKG